MVPGAGEISLRFLLGEGVEPMKTLRMTLAVAGLFLAGPLFAQQQSVETKVPFSFYVGNSQLMPSGTYRITQCTDEGPPPLWSATAMKGWPPCK